jgi:ubiquitin C-terminal hydrolase
LEYPVGGPNADDDWSCQKCHQKIVDSKEELDILLAKLEEIKINVSNLDVQNNLDVQLRKQFETFNTMYSSLTNLLAPNCEEVLSGRDFLHALVSKLFGNKRIH